MFRAILQSVRQRNDDRGYSVSVVYTDDVSVKIEVNEATLTPTRAWLQSRVDAKLTEFAAADAGAKDLEALVGTEIAPTPEAEDVPPTDAEKAKDAWQALRFKKAQMGALSVDHPAIRDVQEQIDATFKPEYLG